MAVSRVGVRVIVGDGVVGVFVVELLLFVGKLLLLVIKLLFIVVVVEFVVSLPDDKVGKKVRKRRISPRTTSFIYLNLNFGISFAASILRVTFVRLRIWDFCFWNLEISEFFIAFFSAFCFFFWGIAGFSILDFGGRKNEFR